MPSPPPGDLPDPETEPASPASPALQTDSLPPWAALNPAKMPHDLPPPLSARRMALPPPWVPWSLDACTIKMCLCACFLWPLLEPLVGALKERVGLTTSAPSSGGDPSGPSVWGCFTVLRGRRAPSGRRRWSCSWGGCPVPPGRWISARSRELGACSLPTIHGGEVIKTLERLTHEEI